MSTYFSYNFGDGTSVKDASNNEILTFDTNASATNNLQITNNASGSNVSIEVIGADTDIGLNLNPKGHGKVNILGSTSNTGSVRFYNAGSTDSGNYVGLRAASSIDNNIEFILPSSDGSNGHFLKTDGVGNMSFGAATAGAGGSDTEIQFNNDGSLDGVTNFTTNDAGTQLTITSSADLRFGGANQKLSGDGSNITINSGRSILLTATSNVIIPSSVPLSFATDDAEKITGDGTDLTLNSGADINLTATTDVNIPSGVGLTFGNDGEKIEGDGTDLTISGNNINLTAVDDVVIPAGVGITFGTGEKIEGDNNDLTITSGRDIILTATDDVNIPSGVGLTFGDDGEKIEGDGTNLTIASSNVMNLTPSATSNVVITQGTLVFSNETIAQGAVSTSSGSPTSKSVTTIITYYNFSGTSNHYTIVSGNPATAGQLWHVFFNISSTATLRIDFGSSGLASGSGLAQYLTFNTTGQAATLIYMASKWRIINTGAAVSS